VRQAILFFPDTVRLTEFLLKHKVKNAEVNSSDVALRALLTEDQNVKACTEYRAVLSAVKID
jgi:hypothetical protein